MSENQLEMDENEVHYVYGDQEYVLGQEEASSELGDLICADGSRAILVDGQYIVTDSQTILLQEGDSNLTQFYINDNNEGFVVGGEDNSVNNLFDGTEILQLVEEDTSDGQKIIYYTNEASNNEVFASQIIPEEADVEGIQDEEGNIYPFKRIKMEGQFLSFDELVQKQEESLNSNQTLEQNRVQYALMEDGSFQIIDTDSVSSAPVTKEELKTLEDTEMVDLSKITGRNLITGQTVTLHGYMDKLKKKVKSNNSNVAVRKKPSKKIYNEDIRKPSLTDLLDKKISIGKTKSGKKIVGKIIRVEKKLTSSGNTEQSVQSNNEQEETDDSLVINDPVPESSEVNETSMDSVNNTKQESSTTNEEVTKSDTKSEEQTKILVKKSSVSKESFEQISKTLGGVMEMESVRKKLESKNIVVKLVEKKYASESDTFIKTTSYSYGYMDKEMIQVDNEIVERWKFVHDQDTQDVLLWGHTKNKESVEGQNEVSRKTTKYPVTTSLTIAITYGKAGNKTIRVNMDPAPGNLCTICAQYFKTNVQLRHHIRNVHNVLDNITCEICDKKFSHVRQLNEHRNIHIQEGKLLFCDKCNKCFSSQSKLKKHLPTHDVYLRPLECSVCEVRCASEWALKKHLLTHTGIKLFACDICNKQFLTQYDVNFHKKIHFPDKYFACNICLRTFSRHSNLLRHSEIHKGSGALYKCDICDCSYNYISSLTRHMVQNHMETADFRKRVPKCDKM